VPTQDRGSVAQEALGAASLTGQRALFTNAGCRAPIPERIRRQIACWPPGACGLSKRPARELGQPQVHVQDAGEPASAASAVGTGRYSCAVHTYSVPPLSTSVTGANSAAARAESVALAEEVLSYDDESCAGRVTGPEGKTGQRTLASAVAAPRVQIGPRVAHVKRPWVQA
jgi:hypothetical protein